MYKQKDIIATDDLTHLFLSRATTPRRSAGPISFQPRLRTIDPTLGSENYTRRITPLRRIITRCPDIAAAPYAVSNGILVRQIQQV